MILNAEVGMRRSESLASQISHRHTQTHTDNFLSKAVLSVLVRVCLWPIIYGMRSEKSKGIRGQLAENRRQMGGFWCQVSSTGCQI
jgi:hypothetical protein